MFVSIRSRLLVLLAGLAILAAGMTAWMGYSSARAALEEQALLKLTAVRELKVRQVEDYFLSLHRQVLTLAQSSTTADALRAFDDAGAELAEADIGDGGAEDLALRLHYEREFVPRLEAGGVSVQSAAAYWPRDAVQRQLQHAYLVGNPFETGKKHLLDEAGSDSAYDQAHRLHHPVFRRLLEHFGYYDLFLIEPEEGRVIYSVYKEVDFASSLETGPYRETNFARAYREALEAGREGLEDEAFLVDFESYEPSYGAPASFLTAPVLSGGELLGVVAIQVPIDRIEDTMTSGRAWSEIGLGESGEAYLVGDDFTLRNQSRFLIEDREAYLRMISELGVADDVVDRIAVLGSSVGLQEVRTEGTLAAQAGEIGTGLYPDYRGVPVLGAYMPVDIHGVRWVAMAEIDAEEAFRPADRLRNRSAIWLGVIVLASLVLGSLLARNLTRPLVRLSATASRIAAGDLDVDVPSRRRDEIGDLAHSIDGMRQSIREQVERQEREIEALSTPLIPLGQGLVVLPLVGEMDSHRMDRLRENLVEGLHASSARIALLDLTGVSRLDPELAPGLVRAAQASRLVGARVVITGLQPELATPIADLDLNLEGLDMARTLREGIDRAFELIGPQANATSNPNSEHKR